MVFVDGNGFFLSIDVELVNYVKVILIDCLLNLVINNYILIKFIDDKNVGSNYFCEFFFMWDVVLIDLYCKVCVLF